MSGKPKAYISAEDSALLRRSLEGFKGAAFLEVGAGNAGTLVGLSGRFGMTVGTDIVRPETDDWKAKASYVLCDRASCFRGSSFDLVAFNPPYLRGGASDAAVEGGRELEVPLRFLREALRVVKPVGRVVFLLNDGAELPVFSKECLKAGFALRKLVSERLFFEEIAVYEAVPLEEDAEDRAGAGVHKPSS